MSGRVHLYAKIHKAQRAWLARSIVTAGRLDADDAAAHGLLAADVRRLAHHIHEHGEHEERFIHPLLGEAAVELATQLDAEHAELDSALAELVTAADGGEASQLYRALTGFVVRYFPHLDIEEQQAMPAMWHRFDDGALLERILRPFIAARSSAEMIEDLNLQIGVLSPQEERQLLGALLVKR
jgi:hypothetical protein